jgi:hypothetical protein
MPVIPSPPTTYPSSPLYLAVSPPPSPHSASLSILLLPPLASIPCHPSGSLALPGLFAVRVPATKGTSGHRIFVSGIDAGLSILPSLSRLWPLPQSGGWNWVRDRVSHRSVSLKKSVDGRVSLVVPGPVYFGRIHHSENFIVHDLRKKKSRFTREIFEAPSSINPIKKTT